MKIPTCPVVREPKQAAASEVLSNSAVQRETATHVKKCPEWPISETSRIDRPPLRPALWRTKGLEDEEQ